MKKTVILFTVLLAYQNIIYGQTEFVDYMGVGGGYSPYYEENKGFYILIDYNIGVLFHKIDLGALVGGRTNLSDITAGGQIEYFGFNLFGMGFGSGVAINNEKELSAYFRVSAFFHIISTMKIGMEYEYRTNPEWNINLFVSVPFISNNSRGRNVQYSNLGSNKEIIGRWKKWDEGDGIVIEFKSDKTFEIIRYKNGEITGKRFGYYSTGRIFGQNNMRIVYTDQKKNEGYGVEYILDGNNLSITLNDEMIHLERDES